MPPLRNPDQKPTGGTFSTVGDEPLAKRVRGIRLPVSIDEWIQDNIPQESTQTWLRQVIVDAVKRESTKAGKPIQRLKANLNMETWPSQHRESRLRWLQGLPPEVDLTKVNIFPDMFELELSEAKSTRLANLLVRQHRFLDLSELASMNDEALLSLNNIGTESLATIRATIRTNQPG
ncbi:hypothetical protein IQ268_16935 [Oculatella sp. LEGE 06141]|uniref:hypothetical protein n=1 Tax=Oculatella sp. LEGE 06141 TaxID=1828648 RepID=UPI0018827295|nr:hypothetical protein [Oculatella sp. LEGE 06141]MBE9180251.1 hypothetical protein [Oculatella sp. LEGE 06141]